VKANHKNITFSLPEDLLQKLRVYAASRGVSMTQLAEDAIRKMVANGHDDEYERARRSFMKRLENPPDLGINGQITWRREDLYDRIR
jgi:hypothetical protein